jgi:hypothetical protein
MNSTIIAESKYLFGAESKQAPNSAADFQALQFVAKLE